MAFVHIIPTLLPVLKSMVPFCLGSTTLAPTTMSVLVGFNGILPVAALKVVG